MTWRLRANVGNSLSSTRFQQIPSLGQWSSTWYELVDNVDHISEIVGHTIVANVSATAFYYTDHDAWCCRPTKKFAALHCHAVSLYHLRMGTRRRCVASSWGLFYFGNALALMTQVQKCLSLARTRRSICRCWYNNELWPEGYDDHGQSHHHLLYNCESRPDGAAYADVSSISNYHLCCIFSLRLLHADSICFLR